MVEQVRRLGQQALVDQQADALPQRQGDGGGEQQGDQRTQRPPAVGSEKGAGQAQGAAQAGRQEDHGRLAGKRLLRRE
ncbi:hypothetical protein D3C78_1811000 [compost metagenome]